MLRTSRPECESDQFPRVAATSTARQVRYRTNEKADRGENRPGDLDRPPRAHRRRLRTGPDCSAARARPNSNERRIASSASTQHAAATRTGRSEASCEQPTRGCRRRRRREWGECREENTPKGVRSDGRDSTARAHASRATVNEPRPHRTDPSRARLAPRRILLYHRRMSAISSKAKHSRDASGCSSAITIVVGITIGSGIFRSPAGIADRLPGSRCHARRVGRRRHARDVRRALARRGGELYPKTGGIYVFLREGWGGCRRSSSAGPSSSSFARQRSAPSRSRSPSTSSACSGTTRSWRRTTRTRATRRPARSS